MTSKVEEAGKHFFQQILKELKGDTFGIPEPDMKVILPILEIMFVMGFKSGHAVSSLDLKQLLGSGLLKLASEE